MATSGGDMSYATISGVLYVIHSFTESGDFVVSDTCELDVLIVAGGGGGGSNRGSGGGAGGLLFETGVTISPGTYSVVVGNGGSGAISNSYAGLPGEDSAVFGITASGGGGGARPSVDYGPAAQMDGGCGGGGDTSTANYGLGVVGQGYNGGTPFDGLRTAGAGGGGATGVGQDAALDLGGNGGPGKNMSEYFGTSYGENGYFAGGGGGGVESGSGGLGGVGGGGDGCSGSSIDKTAGTVNTGGGGGGGSEASRPGMDGGSGIVIIRRYISSYTGYFSGYVYELGNPVQRTVYLHNRSTGELVDSTTSSGNGYYYLETTYSGAHYIVALDDEAREDYNDLIIGNVYPTEVE
jgi:hypothetical protein